MGSPTEEEGGRPLDSMVVIPTYNERENIGKLIPVVLEQDAGIHILVVDDASPDGTADLVKTMQKENDRIHLILRSGKMGLGSAYREGFGYALESGAEYILEMDADFSHDPHQIPRFLDEIQQYDLVIGSRYLRGVNVVNWPISRLLLSYFANMYARIITGIPVRDCTGGYKCFRRKTLEAIDLSRIHSDGYAFQIEMNYHCWKAKFRIREISIVFTDRIDGISKMSHKIIFEAVWMVWVLRFPSLRNLFRSS
jgi:dolichol-phosphate mannosyltransferase